MAELHLDQINDDFIACFQAKVDYRGASECWLWKDPVNHDGYGRVSIAGRSYPAHVVSLVISDQPSPSPKHEACHRCDNPQCVNPDHLWWGLHIENVRDAAQKGRWSRKIYNRITRHHINLMFRTDEELEKQARKWRVPFSHLANIRSQILSLRPRIGDPVGDIPHPRHP